MMIIFLFGFLVYLLNLVNLVMNMPLAAMLGDPIRDIKIPAYEDLLQFDEQTKGIVYSTEPAMQLTMIFERDLCFVEALKHAPGKLIVGIFGMSHIHGILKCWNINNIHFDKLQTYDQGIQESVELWSKIFGETEQDVEK